MRSRCKAPDSRGKLQPRVTFKLFLLEERPLIIVENIARKLRGNADILIIAENIARKLRGKLPLGRPRSHVSSRTIGRLVPDEIATSQSGAAVSSSYALVHVSFLNSCSLIFLNSPS
jgi:hypothetical protein